MAPRPLAQGTTDPARVQLFQVLTRAQVVGQTLVTSGFPAVMGAPAVCV